MQLRRVPWLLLLIGGCGGAYATGEEQDAGLEPFVDAGSSFEAGAAKDTGSLSPDDDGGVAPEDATVVSKDSGPDAATKVPDAATTAPDAGYTTWTATSFAYKNEFGSCTGAKYIRYSAKYKLYVGVQLCSAKRYKIYLGKTATATFYEIADGAGGGEDQCEFIVPTFTQTNPDDIASGNCPTCKIDFAGLETGSNGVFVRGSIGEAPVFTNQWPQQNYTAHWFECGVTIP